MLRLLLASCLLVTIQGASLPKMRRHQHLRNIFPNGKIVGGAATTIDAVPWQVALEDSGSLFCGGSIISANYVLTAAHCTDGGLTDFISVRSGTSKLESGGNVTQVTSVMQNPGFTVFNNDYDVSILKLAQALTLGEDQQAVVLRSTEATADEIAQVAGWGTLDSGDIDLPSDLQRVSVPVVARANCTATYKPLVTSQTQLAEPYI